MIMPCNSIEANDFSDVNDRDFIRTHQNWFVVSWSNQHKHKHTHTHDQYIHEHMGFLHWKRSN